MRRQIFCGVRWMFCSSGALIYRELENKQTDRASFAGRLRFAQLFDGETTRCLFGNECSTLDGDQIILSLFIYVNFTFTPKRGKHCLPRRRSSAFHVRSGFEIRNMLHLHVKYAAEKIRFLSTPAPSLCGVTRVASSVL